MKEFYGMTEENLGRVMKKYRAKSGYTQQKVADYLGIDRSTYTKYETVRKPELDVIMKLAVLYDVSLDEMFSDFLGGSAKSALASSPEKNDNVCSDDSERTLLMYYRECTNKKEVLEKVRELWLEEAKANGAK